MSDPKSIPAKYDSNRLSNGHFAPRNRASVSWSSEVAQRFRAAQSAWLEAVTDQDMAAVVAELKWCCMQRDDLAVKQRSIVYMLDRCLGKPVERIDVSTSDSAPAPVLDLRPEEVAVLERLVQRTDMIVDVDATMVVKETDA